MKAENRIYLLNKTKLNNDFRRDYQLLSDTLEYENVRNLYDPQKNETHIFDDSVVVCPSKLKIRFDDIKKSEYYIDVMDLLIRMVMIGNRFSNITRIIVGIMIQGLLEAEPKVFWSVDDIQEYAYNIGEEKLRIHIASIKDALDNFIFIEKDNKYILNLDQLRIQVYKL